MPWMYYDTKKKDTMVVPLDLAPLVEHHTYLAFGLDEAKLEHLLGEMQKVGRKTKGRQGFEIICYGIRSKDDKCPISFVAGQGVQITKHNYGTRQFVILALLWSNTRTFSFLLMDNDVFNSLEIDAVDPISDGKLAMQFIHFNGFVFLSVLPAPPLYKVRHQELVPFLSPCCSMHQNVHSSIVEEWPLKERLTSVDNEKITFTMDWWTTYYDYGLKRQSTITPGQILVDLKAQADARAEADARAAAEKVPEKGTTNGVKKSKRNHAVNQKCTLSEEEVQERARATLDLLGLKKRGDSSSNRDQLDRNEVKRLRGGCDPVVEDPRIISMQEQMGELQSMVLQLLDAKVQHELM